jgi:hypothetical protein
MECTPLHIYFSLDLLLHFCVPALQSHITTDDVPAATVPQNGPQGKCKPHCYIRAAAWQRTPQKERITSLLGRCLLTDPDPKENATAAQQQPTVTQQQTDIHTFRQTDIQTDFHFYYIR